MKQAVVDDEIQQIADCADRAELAQLLPVVAGTEGRRDFHRQSVVTALRQP